MANLTDCLLPLIDTPSLVSKVEAEMDKRPGYLRLNYLDKYGNIRYSISVKAIISGLHPIDDHITIKSDSRLRGITIPDLNQGFSFYHPDTEPDWLIDEYFERRSGRKGGANAGMTKEKKVDLEKQIKHAKALFKLPVKSS